MKPKPIYLIIGITIGLLAGCVRAPEYTRPEAPVSDTWPTGAAYRPADATETGAELPWQEFFTDDGLKAAIATALDHNRDLRLAALNVRRAQAMYGIQRAGRWPSLDATATGTRTHTPGDLSYSGEASESESYQVDFGISAWEIDFFGRLGHLKDKALEQYLATEEAQRSARILLISNVANAYLALTADRRQLELARSTLAAQQETFALMQRRFELGIASALDLHRARAQVDAARGDVVRFIRQVAQDQNALNLLAGSAVAIPEAMLATDAEAPPPCRNISAGLSSAVLLQRPDIRAAEHNLRAADADIGAARAAFFPRIVLTARAGTASAELSGLFGADQETWSFAPRIVLPIFDARLKSAYAQTQTEREIALTNYEKAIQTAFREVADALAVQGTVGEQLAAGQSLVDTLTEAHRLSAVRYDKGIDSYLSVLDAQRSLYSARQGLINIHLIKLTNQVRLYSLLGGGVE